MSLAVLFLHTNYPGQFKHLSRYLVQEGHDVKFITDTNFQETLKGIDLILTDDKPKINSECEILNEIVCSIDIPDYNILLNFHFNENDSSIEKISHNFKTTTTIINNSQ